MYFKIGLLFVAGLLMMTNPTLAQKKKKGKEEVKIEIPAFKMSDAHLITYSEVVTATGTSKEIYAKALAWMNSFYKNPTNVIKAKDEATGKLRGTARFRVWSYSPDPKSTSKSQAGLVQYSISILCKDGKYKYVLTKIGHKQSTFQPAEKWIAENEKGYKRDYASFLVQVDEEMKRVIASLNSAMKGASSKKSEDDW